MKILEAGTLRYLLLDTAEIERNRQRRAARGPVVIVAEADPARPGAFNYTEGFGLLTDGPLAVVYNPTSKIALLPDKYTGGRIDVLAAYSTYGRIAVAESVEEAGALELSDEMVASADAPKPPTTTARPSAKQPKVKKPEEGSK